MPILPAILEVAIGAALIFFTLSAICSSLSELISNLLDLRSKFLEQGVVALLSHPDQVQNVFDQVRKEARPVDNYSRQLVPFLQGLIDHPLMRKLGRTRGTNPAVHWLRARAGSTQIKLPAYIPSETFSSALLDQIRELALDPAARAAALESQLESWKDNRQALEPVLNALKNQDGQQALAQARSAIALVPDDKLRTGVLALFDAQDPAKRIAALKAQLQTLGDELGDGAVSGSQIPHLPKIPPSILNAFDGVDPHEALQLARQSLPLIEDENVRATVTNLLGAWELSQIQQGIKFLPEPPRKILLAFVAETQAQIGQVEQLKGRIEDWFDNSMGQVTIWYKRYLGLFLRAFAVIVCIVFNADALHIVDTLWRDPTVRAALVAQASSTVNNPSAPRPTPVPGATPAPGTGLGSAVQIVQSELQQAETLPGGWNCNEFNATFRQGYRMVTPTPTSAGPTTAASPSTSPFGGLCDQVEVRAADGSSQTYIVQGNVWMGNAFWLKVIGLLLMSLGVSLGSDFWYKALQQLVKLREDKPAS